MFFWLMILMILSMEVFAQKKQKNELFGFHFKGKRQVTARIPFEIYSNLIIIKVRVDESDTLNFIFDTGVSSFIITDQTIAKKLKLNVTRTVRINGAGEKDYLEGKVSLGHKIDIGEIQAIKQNMVVLNEDLLKLSEYMGITVHGIFGHDLFERFVVKIDFGSKNIWFEEPSRFKIRKSMGDVYPLIVTQSKPYLEDLQIAQNGHDFQKLRLLVDTGAGHALLLNTQDNPPIYLPDKVIRANLGRGLNGNIDGHIGRIGKFKIGNFEFSDVLASFPDSLAFSMKFGDEINNRQGCIGGEFLRRFILTFNYQKGYLIMKPLKSKYRETFEHDMSGLEVRVKGENLDKFVITFVTPGSQAYLAGLQENDEIIFINNKHAKTQTINDIYRLLSKKEGTEIEIFYRRGVALNFAYFKLKRII